MTDRNVYEMVCMIYALFSKAAPRQDSASVQALVDNLRDIPDDLSGYIYRKFQDLDSLPQNLTKACRGFWETWKMENPRSVYREQCQTCRGSGGFEAYEKLSDGTVHHFFAMCPQCAAKKEGFRYLTPSQWETRGVLCMPPGYPGGKLQFEYDYGITEKPEDSPKSYRNMRALKLLMNHRTGYDRGYAMQNARKAS